MRPNAATTPRSGREITNGFEKGLVANPRRLQDRDSVRVGNLPGWRGVEMMPAPARAVGLRDDRHDLVWRGEERLERRHRERRRAEVDDA